MPISNCMSISYLAIKIKYIKKHNLTIIRFVWGIIKILLPISSNISRLSDQIFGLSQNYIVKKKFLPEFLDYDIQAALLPLPENHRRQ